ncbi:ABC transporter permease [Candidatus Caldatribacterium sp.]|uniref:ABC transporter permease n=1 Tax=Candidatus Caldatribacterium sp. TaxID=2282143 RepID=UPI00299C98DD|nr:ABC transporter permease [Candidatus Caldatribacterium sp.]MDW8080333.1 ABC transporter permease [Candidatus Calescibacterium sp.]
MDFLSRVLLLAIERRSLVLLGLREHITISLLACLFIALCGIPLGILIARFRAVAPWVIGVTGVLYTIPALALFGFMIPLLGIGIRPTLFALFIYGLLPLVRNTYVGITTVDAAVVEAARGMGSTEWQLLWRVQIPLALPVIVAGFRTVVVMTISVATIAAFIGAGGLGVLIFRGITSYYPELVVLGSLLVAALAVGVDGALGLVERKLLRRVQM